MNIIKQWFIAHWKNRIFKVSTVIALIMLYMNIFDHVELKQFLNYLFLDVGRKIIDRLIANDDFIGMVVGALTVWLGWTKRF